MSFFGLFKSNGKAQSKQQKVKIYKDDQCQSYFQNLQIEDSTQCYRILDQIDTQFQQGDDIRKVLILRVCADEKKIILERIINKQEQIVKILRSCPINCEQFIIYQEIKIQKLLESQQYHSKSWNHNASNLKEHSYRQGTLLKKAKNGQFRERIFKLFKDTLIFEKNEKNKQKKQSCISLDSMEIEKPKEKNLIFLIKCDQKVYQIKAQSRTDYDGWTYSLQVQIIKWKETKLLLDYDKKIESVAQQKVEKLKNLHSQLKSIKTLIQANNYITIQFEKFVQSNYTEFDYKLFEFLKHCIQTEQSQQFGSSNVKVLIELRDRAHQEIITQMEQHYYLKGIENKQLNSIKQEVYKYFDEKIIPIFQQKSDQKTILLDYSVHQFQQYLKFQLPETSNFYQDPNLEENKQLQQQQQIFQE